MFLFDEREFKIFRSFRVISLDPEFGDLSNTARCLSSRVGDVGSTETFCCRNQRLRVSQ